MRRVCRPLRCNYAVGLFCLLSMSAFAQLNIQSSPNVVGSGARALGMGGAFIAVADDATAASWNPGGLTQLERPELSLVYDFDWFGEDFSSTTHPELGGDFDVNLHKVNYFSAVYPIPWTLAGRNFVVSLNYQRKYDFDRDLRVRFLQLGASAGSVIERLQTVDYKQRGILAALSPAFGFEITDTLSVGMVLNIYDQSLLPDNEWEVRQVNRIRTAIDGVIPPFGFVKFQQEERYRNFEGMNFTVGTLWKPTERLSIGAVYHSKFTADVDYMLYQNVLVSNSLAGGILQRKRPQQYTFPSAFGLGVAYRFPNDKLTLTFDVTRREWDQFVILDPHNLSLAMQRRSAVSGLPKWMSPHDPTYTVRLGMEYVFVNERKPKQDYLPSLRAGVFYDPEPSSGRPDRWYGLGNATGSVDDYFGVTLGVGVLIKNRVNLDAAYVYRWGTDVRKDTFGLAGTDADVDQHILYFSTVIYF